MNDAPISFGPPVSGNPPSQNDAEPKRDDQTTQLKQMESRVFRFAVGLVILSMILYFVNATCKQIVDLISAQNESSMTISQSLDYYAYFSPLKDTQDKLLPPPPEFHHALIEFSRWIGRLRPDWRGERKRGNHRHAVQEMFPFHLEPPVMTILSGPSLGRPPIVGPELRRGLNQSRKSHGCVSASPRPCYERDGYPIVNGPLVSNL
jgi:hypothetical protein